MPVNKKKLAAKIIAELIAVYPAFKIALDYSTPFELLIATILSAQCTDIRINQLTKTLFKKYKTPVDYLKVSVNELENDIFPSGFYRAKTKSIRACCSEIISNYNGIVPSDFENLNKLPGVGRKTASVVVGNAFGIPAIAVDTHVKRISNLLGLVQSNNPDKIEIELKEIVDKKDWVKWSHLLATHGRTICNARKPDCKNCVIIEMCSSAKFG